MANSKHRNNANYCTVCPKFICHDCRKRIRTIPVDYFKVFSNSILLLNYIIYSVYFWLNIDIRISNSNLDEKKSVHVFAFSRNSTLYKVQHYKILVMTTTLQIHWKSSENECKWKIRKCYMRRINFHVLQMTLRKLIWVCYYPFTFAKIFFFEFVSVCMCMK